VLRRPQRGILRILTSNGVGRTDSSIAAIRCALIPISATSKEKM